jgi:hypothetical protein
MPMLTQLPSWPPNHPCLTPGTHLHSHQTLKPPMGFARQAAAVADS